MAKGLGKGINALFREIEAGKGEAIIDVKVNDLKPNPYQPRKAFQESAIEELKESILQHGILQPLIIRKTIKGYDIVAGERRFRAAKAAGLETVPAVIRELTEQQMMEIALLENLQREDLTTIEEARAYHSLMEKLSLTQEELAKRLGKSRSHIANHVRLLSLPSFIQNLMMDGNLSMGHGRTLLGLKKKDKLQPLVDKILKESLNVRQVEQLVHELNEGQAKEKKKQVPEKDVFLKERENYFAHYFGTPVSINQKKDKGTIEIEFFSKDDLDRILNLLEVKQPS
ncbi:ParB/RepB/Spo0J family partition protein [Metabacillus sp. GX 13764]|uniref:ParB/RepB/Spo0J family partition protein n=1 Tax=Metabacillus kandeliae TaxID=2900151 RepID=UPI001E3E908A|nr:ParB/RepB/Spo0J family partition protein [Metabacillus kandeliae]MCD7035290.1 ParB/RepB/Spo0J family partition protein [Metabacillus kandeliae]